MLLQHGAPGVNRDEARAVRLYRRAAFEGGHVGAMEKLGQLLEHGAPGVLADPDGAKPWTARGKEFADVQT